MGRLNNNSLSGTIPESLSRVGGLTLVDLSFNNFSGSLPKLSARTFKINGNPLLCTKNSVNNCSVIYPEPLSLQPDDKTESGKDHKHIAIAIGTSFGATFLIIIIIGSLVWWRHRHNQQIFFDVNGLVSMILMRTLRNDYAKYAHEDDDLETLERDVSEESGWKLIHGDVLRPPRSLVLLSAVVGTGAQLAMLVLLVILVSIVGTLYIGYVFYCYHLLRPRFASFSAD